MNRKNIGWKKGNEEIASYFVGEIEREFNTPVLYKAKNIEKKILYDGILGEFDGEALPIERFCGVCEGFIGVGIFVFDPDSLEPTDRLMNGSTLVPNDIFASFRVMEALRYFSEISCAETVSYVLDAVQRKAGRDDREWLAGCIGKRRYQRIMSAVPPKLETAAALLRNYAIELPKELFEEEIKAGTIKLTKPLQCLGIVHPEVRQARRENRISPYRAAAEKYLRQRGLIKNGQFVREVENYIAEGIALGITGKDALVGSAIIKAYQKIMPVVAYRVALEKVPGLAKRQIDGVLKAPLGVKIKEVALYLAGEFQADRSTEDAAKQYEELIAHFVANWNSVEPVELV